MVDGTSSEYINLKGSALDKDLQDFISSSIQKAIATEREKICLKGERNRIIETIRQEERELIVNMLEGSSLK